MRHGDQAQAVASCDVGGGCEIGCEIGCGDRDRQPAQDQCDQDEVIDGDHTDCVEHDVQQPDDERPHEDVYGEEAARGRSPFDKLALEGPDR